MKLKTIFFGSSSFSLPFLEVAYHQSDLRYIVTGKEKRKGRGKKNFSSPILDLARSHSIPVLQLESLKDSSFQDALRIEKPAVFVTASFGKLLPPSLLSIPSLSCINIHPSLLPLYRGADPLFWQLMQQETEGGVSIFQMLPSLDSGPILKQESFPLDPEETYTSLEEKSIQCGVTLLKMLLTEWERGHIVQPLLQVDSCPFYARKRTASDEQIQWNQPRTKIFAQIRALPPTEGAYTLFGAKRIKILSARIASDIPLFEGSPGQIFVHTKKLYVHCQDSALQLLVLKPEGKSEMVASAFINGYLPKNTSSFFCCP